MSSIFSKKTFCYFALFVAIISLFYTPKVSRAQSDNKNPIDSPSNLNYRCVEIEPKSADGEKFDPYNPDSSRVFLATGTGFEPGSTGYLAVCFSKPGQSAPYNSAPANCTTGDANIDQKIGFTYQGEANATRLQKTLSLAGFQGKVEKKIHDFALLNSASAKDRASSYEIKIDANGKLSTHFLSRIVFEYLPIKEGELQTKAVRREVYGLYFTKVDEVNKSTKNDSALSRASSLQYGTIQFSEGLGSCVKNVVLSDPRILAIDSKTGMSLPQVPFTLHYRKEGSAPKIVGEEQVGVINPQSTGPSGWLSWYTSPDHYSIFTPATFFDYKTLTPDSNLNKLFAPFTNPSNNTAVDGEDIDETKGYVERTVLFEKNLSLRAPKLVSPISVRRLESMLIIRGETDLPYVIVSLQGAENYATASNRFGEFYLQIPSTALSSSVLASPQVQLTTQDLIKTPYEQLVLPAGSKPEPLPTKPQNFFPQSLESLFVKNVFAQNNNPSNLTTSVAIDTPLPYLEGVAYDANKKPLSFAAVNVRITSSDAIYATSTTNQDGKFIFYPKSLPLFPYYLEYVSANSKQGYRQTVEQFVKNNSEYLQSEEINLIAGTRQGSPVPVSAEALAELTASPIENAPIFQDDLQNAQSTPTTTPLAKNANYIYLVLFVILLVISTPILYWYFKKLTSK